MKTADVIIVGAGAAGLMAAHKLAASGKKVVVLEARNRTGGRIHTLSDESFFKDTETGAEFIHGDLPVTLGLLQEAGISYHWAGGEVWRHQNDQFKQNDNFITGWDELIERLQSLKEDTDIRSFTEKEFPGDKYAELRKGVYRFVSGYDTAVPERASTFAIRDEWQNEDDGAQYRISGGYCRLIEYLSRTCRQHDAEIYLNSIVKHIQWKKDDVRVFTADGTEYHSSKILIAMPLGVLQAEAGETAAITFEPALNGQQKAVEEMGFGAIIKILLEFDEPFWEDEQRTPGADLKDMAFLLSDQEIPTWWTQSPERSNVLTGWLGGPQAAEKRNASEEELLKESLQSVANLFHIDIVDLKDKLIAGKAINWTADPFTLGSYAYDTIEAHQARKILSHPVEDTIYFAGEYLYEGPAMGTVEAALSSGQAVAGKMMNS